MGNIKTFNKFFENNLEDDSKTSKTIKTTSLKHYKKLREQGIECELVIKSDINSKD